MGCLCSPDVNDDDQLALGMQEDHTSDTYDPGNMSVSRDSAMADYQFTGRGQAAKKKNKKLVVTLAAIPDTEGDANGANSPNNIEEEKEAVSLPRKRAIFISIAQLNACIHTIPSYILSESIFCFKAQRSWFFPETQAERQEAKCSMRYTLNFNDKFLAVLGEKQEKRLVLWLENDKTWTDISRQLTQIEDIFCSHAQPADAAPTTYQPLKLDESWWMNQFKHRTSGVEALFCEFAESVAEELQTHKLKFNPTMELLYQSNPSLIPMRGFDIEAYANAHFGTADEELDADPSASPRLDAVRDCFPITPAPAKAIATSGVDITRVPSVSEAAHEPENDDGLADLEYELAYQNVRDHEQAADV